MKSLLPLLASLLLVPVCIAQQGLPVIEVGALLRRQTAHQSTTAPVNNSQVLGLRADPNDVTPATLGLGPEIRRGSTLWMFTAACEIPLTTGWLQMTSEYTTETHHFFSLTLLTNSQWLLPFGATGHDAVFSDPTFMLVPDLAFETFAPPTWVSTHDMFNVGVVDAYRANYTSLYIPNNPALMGQPFSAQSFRIQDDLYGPALFASDEIVFAIS